MMVLVATNMFMTGLLAMFISTFNSPADGSWFQLSALSTAHNSMYNACVDLPNLSKRQRRLCSKHPTTVRALQTGVNHGINECQRQFNGQRWNCSLESDLGTPMLNAGSREAAFVYAITTAGVVRSIARACSAGLLPSCSCSSPRPLGRVDIDDQGNVFRWGGCSDNLKFAASFARRFLDANERKRDGRALMNLHNNRAGRKLVKRTARLQCKCHGVSGSCTTRTCWRAADSMEHIGQELLTKYTNAVQVVMSADGKTLQPSATAATAIHYDQPLPGQSDLEKHPKMVASGKAKRNKQQQQKQKVRNSELVYFESSPDYCEADLKSGSQGTAGRRCNVSSHGADSCDSLCCGRGYNTHREVVTEKCNCKFVWCCEVQCDLCTRLVEVHTCKGPHDHLTYQQAPNRQLFKPHASSTLVQSDRPGVAYHAPAASPASGYRRLSNSRNYHFAAADDASRWQW